MKPRDAATLIILRQRREVLMGIRNRRHVFMPDRYVFPGGAVDRDDERAPAPIALPATAQRGLLASVTPLRARALAMAAVRETWEETGLRLATPGPVPALDDCPQSWAGFYRDGGAPALDRLQYVARAVTPPGMPRRFDARFFLVDAAHMRGELCGNGELGHLHWVALDEAQDLRLPAITSMVLSLLQLHLVAPERDPASLPGFDTIFGQELFEYHPPA